MFKIRNFYFFFANLYENYCGLKKINRIADINFWKVYISSIVICSEVIVQLSMHAQQAMKKCFKKCINLMFTFASKKKRTCMNFLFDQG